MMVETGCHLFCGLTVEKVQVFVCNFCGHIAAVLIDGHRPCITHSLARCYTLYIRDDEPVSRVQRLAHTNKLRPIWLA